MTLPNQIQNKLGFLGLIFYFRKYSVHIFYSAKHKLGCFIPASFKILSHSELSPGFCSQSVRQLSTFWKIPFVRTLLVLPLKLLSFLDNSSAISASGSDMRGIWAPWTVTPRKLDKYCSAFNTFKAVLSFLTRPLY